MNAQRGEMETNRDDVVATEASAEEQQTAAVVEVPSPVPAPPAPRWDLPVLSLLVLAALPLAACLLWRRRAPLAPWLLVCGGLAVLAALVWPVGQLRMARPWAAVAAPSPREAGAIFQRLHRNVYLAFDAREESRIYDALASSVAGPLLRELYLNIRQGLELEQEGGAVTRVRAVTILDGQVIPATPSGADADPRRFGYQCHWTVDAVVRHWGHVHERTNAYEAHFTIEPRDGFWKITDVQAWREERGELETIPTATPAPDAR